MRITKAFIALTVLTLWGCTKTEQELKPVKAFSLASNKAMIDWSGVFPDEKALSFEVYLSDSLLTELSQVFYYVIDGLEEETHYSGQIVASGAASGTRYSMPFSFVTQKNKAPEDFSVTLDRITGGAVSLSWKRPFDPEGDSITYDLVVNEETIAHGLTGTDHTLEGLAPTTHYSLTVVAKDGHGNDVPWSAGFKTLVPGAEIAYVKEPYQGQGREYGIYLPSGTGSGNLPLVISLHGWGGVVWPEMITDYFVTLAEKEQFILLMPQALGDQQGNLAWRESYDIDFLRQLMDTVIVRHQADMERIYLTGHSNGGFMTYILAKALEYRLAAIGPIAGTLAYPTYNSYSLLKPMPLCHIHGTADSTVQVQGNPTHVSFEKVLAFFIPNNNCDPEPTVTELPDTYKYDNSTVTKIEYHTLGVSSGDIVYYRINNGNHSVPGTRSWANKDIHAYDVLWEFFKPRKLSDK